MVNTQPLENKFNHLLIAHRGESFDAPENTLASVNLAWERGAQAVEVDVHLSKDKKVVVIHDSTTKRTGGKSKAVKRQTFEELKLLDFGIFKGELWKGERIPLLSEVIATVPPHGMLIVEIKCGKKIIPFLKEIVKQSKIAAEQVAFISFNFSAISAVKKELLEHKAYWLMVLDYLWPNRFYPYSVSRIVSRVKKHNLDGINVWAGKVADKNFISQVKQKNLSVFLWVVNDPQRAKKYFNFGVDGIATDRASWMREEMGKC